MPSAKADSGRSSKKVRVNWRCKKCGDLFPDNRDYKHYSVCQDTNIVDPQEVLASFEPLY